MWLCHFAHPPRGAADVLVGLGAYMIDTWRDSARHILALAWPVLIGQLSVVAFATVDTMLVARHSPLDLAALAVGASAYVTVFIGLMGVVLAVGPIVGQLFGAGQLAQAGRQLHQAVWLALGLSLLGSTLLLFPAPFLALARLEPEVEAKVRHYLQAVAVGLPASLLFAAYRGFNTAVSRPKAVMVLQLGGLALKVPLSALLIQGAPSFGIPALGVVGGGIATAIAMWIQVVVAVWVMRRDGYYARFELGHGGLQAPDLRGLKTQLRLGVPMGMGILIEVSGFSLMAVFIARLGTTAVAGHQIAVNLVSILFMLPLALSSAISTLVAQRVGARDGLGARRLGWHGVQMGTALAAMIGASVYFGREAIVGLYTRDAAVAAAALPLLAWMAVFHTADALQSLSSFVLRGYRIAGVPMLIFAVSLWGVGLGGGYVVAFDVLGLTPPALRGAPGYWAASTCGLVLAGLTLLGFMAHTLARHAREGRSAAADLSSPLNTAG